MPCSCSHCAVLCKNAPAADLNTPMAPELGLFLDEAYFDGYNKQVRVGSQVIHQEMKCMALSERCFLPGCTRHYALQLSNRDAPLTCTFTPPPAALQWGELHGNLSLAPWQADADAFKVQKGGVYGTRHSTACLPLLAAASTPKRLASNAPPMYQLQLHINLAATGAADGEGVPPHCCAGRGGRGEQLLAAVAERGQLPLQVWEVLGAVLGWRRALCGGEAALLGRPPLLLQAELMLVAPLHPCAWLDRTARRSDLPFPFLLRCPSFPCSKWEEQVSRIRLGGGRRTPSRAGSGGRACLAGLNGCSAWFPARSWQDLP